MDKSTNFPDVQNIICLINSKQNLKIFAPFCKIIEIRKVQSTFQSDRKLLVSILNRKNYQKLAVYPKLSYTDKIFLKFGNRVKSTSSKAKRANLVSFLHKKNATSCPLKFLWILAMIPEEC